MATQSIDDLIEEAKQTGRLELHGRNLTAIPQAVFSLTHMHDLSLDSNQLQEVPKELGQLSSLQYLLLSNNQLQEVPKELGQLSSLQYLDLGNNQLQEVPKELGQLSSLQILDLSSNQFQKVPKELDQLSSLKFLFLDNNQLQEVPKELGQLTGLLQLSLQNNQLQEVPKELGQLSSLEVLSLDGNPLLFPPAEIAELGVKAIQDYLNAGPFTEQWVSKLILVGQGEHGKTSLLKRLRGQHPDHSEPSTVGIEIHPLRLPHPSRPEVSIQLNAWDFGGQEIQHSTHQFFLTPNAIFLVIWKPRTDTEKLWYWLDTIQVQARNARVIIVATHKQADWPADLPMAALREKYGEMILGQFEVCSFTQGPESGIDDLLNFIAAQAAKPDVLPLMGQRWPRTWLAALTELRQLRETKNYLWRGDFTALLERHGIPEAQHRTLGRWLHELGEILYHDRESELRRFVLLNSQWTSNTICRLLQSEEVARRRGVLTRTHLAELWRDLRDEDLRQFMLKLMHNFDLAYEVSISANDEASEDVSLVVDRIPHDPTPQCEQRWQQICERESCSEIAIRYQFHHRLTAGIPTWLIARQHRFSIGEHWRQGVLFAEAEKTKERQHAAEYRHLARIEANPDRRSVSLRVRGPQPIYFFTLIRDGFEDTLRKLPNPNYDIFVPCPGHNGQACAGEFKLEKLEEFLVEKKKRTQDCPESGDDVEIQPLLYGLKVKHTAQQIAERVTAEISSAEVSYLQLSTVAVSFVERAQEDTIHPFIFWLRPYDESQPLREMFKRKFYLHLCCECPGSFHPLTLETGNTDPDEGRYLIEDTSDLLREWKPGLEKALSTINLVKKPLSLLIKAVTGIPSAPDLGAAPDLRDRLKSPVSSTVRELTPHDEGFTIIPGLTDDNRYFYRAEGATYRQVKQLLMKLDDKQVFGNLEPMVTPEGYRLMMCREHHQQYRRLVMPVQDVRQLERQ